MLHLLQRFSCSVNRALIFFESSMSFSSSRQLLRLVLLLLLLLVICTALPHWPRFSMVLVGQVAPGVVGRLLPRGDDDGAPHAYLFCPPLRHPQGASRRPAPAAPPVLATPFSTYLLCRVLLDTCVRECVMRVHAMGACLLLGRSPPPPPSPRQRRPSGDLGAKGLSSSGRSDTSDLTNALLADTEHAHHDGEALSGGEGSGGKGSSGGGGGDSAGDGASPTIMDEIRVCLARPLFVFSMLGYAAYSGGLIGFSTFGPQFVMGLGYFEEEYQVGTHPSTLLRPLSTLVST